MKCWGDSDSWYLGSKLYYQDIVFQSEESESQLILAYVLKNRRIYIVLGNPKAKTSLASGMAGSRC